MLRKYYNCYKLTTASVAPVVNSTGELSNEFMDIFPFQRPFDCLVSSKLGVNCTVNGDLTSDVSCILKREETQYTLAN